MSERRVYHHPNGKVFLEGMVEENVRFGKWVKYYDSGIMESEVHYDNGILEGESKQYYENGNVMEEGVYVKGAYEIKNYWNPEGVQTVKDGNGIVVKDLGEMEDELIIIMYRNGELVSEGTGPKSILTTFLNQQHLSKKEES